jgi:hypothetical protein
MAPIPVITLLAPAISIELAIVSVPFTEVYAVRTVLAVIPLVVVMMMAIVVAIVIAASGDNHFLRAGCLGCYRGGESRSEKKKTQVFCS